MKWTRSRGSAPIPFSLSLFPPFLCHAGRSVSSQRNERFATGRLNGKVKGDLRQARMRQASRSLSALHFPRSSPLQRYKRWRAIQTDPVHDLQSASLPLSWFIQVTDESLRFLWFTMIGVILLHKSWFGSFQWNTPKDYKIEFFFHVFQCLNCEDNTCVFLILSQRIWIKPLCIQLVPSK